MGSSPKGCRFVSTELWPYRETPAGRRRSKLYDLKLKSQSFVGGILSKPSCSVAERGKVSVLIILCDEKTLLTINFLLLLISSGCKHFPCCQYVINGLLTSQSSETSVLVLQFAVNSRLGCVLSGHSVTYIRRIACMFLYPLSNLPLSFSIMHSFLALVSISDVFWSVVLSAT